MSTPVLPVESAPALSEGQRLLYTFTAPSSTMADIRRKPSWWVPWLVVSIVSIAFCVALEKRIGWEQVMETQMQHNAKTAEKMEKMPADQREKIMKVQVSVAKGFAYASPVTVLVSTAIIAAVLLGIFNFGFGAKLRFGEMMAISMYSSLVSVIKTALMIVVVFMVEAEQYDIGNPVATNPGYFVPASMHVLKGVLGAFDIFTLWQIFLIAVGVSTLSKVKKWPAFAAMFGLFFLVKLVGAGLGSL
jgi:hypothetical protein